MNDLEKAMNNLPKLLYKLKNGTLIVLGFQSQSMDDPYGKLGINVVTEASHYFNEMINLFRGELEDDEYNKKLVYLYKRIRDLLDDYPKDISDCRKQLEKIMGEADIIQKQIEMYKYIRSIYSRYN